MRCWDCKYFKIKWEPIGKISTGLWDFGEAACTKHDLVVSFPNHRKLKKLECVEKVNPRIFNKDAQKTTEAEKQDED